MDRFVVLIDYLKHTLNSPFRYFYWRTFLSHFWKNSCDRLRENIWNSWLLWFWLFSKTSMNVERQASLYGIFIKYQLKPFGEKFWSWFLIVFHYIITIFCIIFEMPLEHLHWSFLTRRKLYEKYVYLGFQVYKWN